MQPQSTTKPPTDLPEPVKPAAPAAGPVNAPAGTPVSVQTTVPASAPVSARSENMSMATPPDDGGSAAPAEAAEGALETELPPMPVPPSKQPKPARTSTTPVGIIIVTIFFMVVLSALAVTVYLTSQSS